MTISHFIKSRVTNSVQVRSYIDGPNIPDDMGHAGAPNRSGLKIVGDV